MRHDSHHLGLFSSHTRPSHVPLTLVLCVVLSACGGDTAGSGVDPTPNDQGGMPPDMTMPDMHDTGDMLEPPDLIVLPVTCAEDERVVQNICVACPAGTTNVAGDDASGPDTVCDEILCGEDERVLDNTCVGCGPGEVNMAGDLASGQDTMCDGELCPSNTSVQSNACVACPPGTQNEAGDDASLDDTTCDPIVCEQDFFVQSNMCAMCPPGALNDPGDEASGPDTVCDPILCERDQRVIDHRCVSCPMNETRPPGDDASGPDTRCLDECEAVLGVDCDLFYGGYFKASNTHTGAIFGSAVALDGDTMAVAADNESGGSTGIDGDQTDLSKPLSGAVYVFVRDMAGEWSQQAYIKASNAESNDDFGWSIALQGDTLVVGANREDSSGASEADNSTDSSGAVYVFERSGTTWTQQAYLKAPTPRAQQRFGESLALEGDFLAVGAPGDQSSATGIDGDDTLTGALNSGAVHVFERSANASWSHQAYIKSSNSDPNDFFGESVAMSQDTLVVGAPFEGSSATGVDGDQTINRQITGAVYAFTRDAAGQWTQQAYIKGEVTLPGHQFGDEVALDADTLVIGAPLNYAEGSGVGGSQMQGNSPILAGAAYIFERQAGVWTQTEFLKANFPEAQDLYGKRLAVDGDLVVVSALRENGLSRNLDGDQSQKSKNFDSGAVFVYERSAQGWSELAYIKSPRVLNQAAFGSALALDDGLLVIGEPGETSESTGVNPTPGPFNAAYSGAVFLRRISP